MAALRPALSLCRAEAIQLRREAPQIGREVAERLLARVGGAERDLRDITKKYHKELAERKRLHNLVQELRGNIRVFCRVRPVCEAERARAGPYAGVSFSSTRVEAFGGPRRAPRGPLVQF